MQPIYEHRQFGLAILILILFPVLGLVAAVILAPEPGVLLPLGLIVAFMLLTALVFSSLTVKVDADYVKLHFGLNAFGRSFPLNQVASVRVVRNPLWMGLGIHFIHHGMIYNVSGRDGVELRMENGRVARIGTDEPVALAQAIEQAKRFHGR